MESQKFIAQGQTYFPSVTVYALNKKGLKGLNMNQVASGSVRWGISKLFNLLQTQGTLKHDQRLRFKEDGRPCPRVNVKDCSSEAVYQNFSWICGDEEKNTYFCWPCLVLGDHSNVRSMLDDFLRSLAELDFEQVWTDTLKADPNFPATRARGGWRGAERVSSGKSNDWKQSMTTVAMQISIEFSKQLAWRFQNLDKFNWINLIHPSNFSKNVHCSSHESRMLIGECQRFYPFAVSDATSLEHNLDVFNRNQEIALLLQKLIKYRDDAAMKMKARKNAKRKRVDEESSVIANEGHENEEQPVIDAEDLDQFELRHRTITENETIKEGVPSMQDLLTVIKETGLADALPHVMTLAEIASVTPLTSVHCERVFSRMKRVISSPRSRMLQTRKQQLVFLQVEQSLLRSLWKQPGFINNIVTRFKGHNQKRLARFSRK